MEIERLFDAAEDAIGEAWDPLREGLDAIPSVDHFPDEVAVHGTVIVHEDRDEFYGGEESQHYYGRVLVNPTWYDLLLELDRAMKVTRDYTHRFLEGYRLTGTMDEGTPVIQLLTGS
jgi:hypothetical protein